MASRAASFRTNTLAAPPPLAMSKVLVSWASMAPRIRASSTRSKPANPSGQGRARPKPRDRGLLVENEARAQEAEWRREHRRRSSIAHQRAYERRVRATSIPHALAANVHHHTGLDARARLVLFYLAVCLDSSWAAPRARTGAGGPAATSRSHSRQKQQLSNGKPSLDSAHA